MIIFNIFRKEISAFSESSGPIVSIVNLLCKQGERDFDTPGLNPEVIKKAVWSCIQEEPVEFMNYSLYDVGAYPEPAIYQKVEWKVTQMGELGNKDKKPKVGTAILKKLLPGSNCKKCGLPTCFAFAYALDQGKKSLKNCPPLSEPEFAEEQRTLIRLLE